MSATRILQTAAAIAIGLSSGLGISNGTVQAAVTGTGAVSATVVVEVSNDNVNFVTLGTLTLSGTNVAVDGFAFEAPWGFIRTNVTAISASSVVVTTLGI